MQYLNLPNMLHLSADYESLSLILIDFIGFYSIIVSEKHIEKMVAIIHTAINGLPRMLFLLNYSVYFPMRLIDLGVFCD